MNKFILYSAVATVFLLVGCKANEVISGKTYTRHEFKKMTYCIGMSDTAMHAATSKVKGIPMDQVTSYYATQEGHLVNIATVEEVYSENFTSVWDYTISFFEGCTLKFARIDAKRVGPASQCAQNSMIAGLAHTYKSLGSPIEKTYKNFAVFKNKMSNRIVDDVYESRYGRAEVKLDEWSSCILKITAD